MNEPDNGGRWLSRKAAAKYVSLNPDTLSRKARNGEIEYGMTDGGEYRFHTSELDRWLREHGRQHAGRD